MKLLALVCLALGASAGGGDSDEQCCGWAIMDECETNPFWMKVNCQKSCGTMGCTVAEAKADSAGASGACKSNIDQGFLASCKWNRAFLEANWNRGGHGGHHGHGAGESSFIVPDAGAAGASAGGYGGEEKVEPAPAMDAPAPEPVVEEPIVVDIVEEVPEEPAAPVVEVVEEPAPAPVEIEEPAPAPIPVYEEEEVVEEPEPVELMPIEPIIERTPIEVEIPVEREPIVEEPAVEEPVVEEEVAEEPLPQMDVVEEAPVEEEAAPAAEDSNESCCGWAAYEECGKNPTWMAKNCAASCHVKDGKVDDAAAIAAAEAACPEYRELFLAGVALGQAKKEEEAAPVEEEAAPVEEEAAPVEEEAAPVVEEEEAPEEPAMDFHSGGYRRLRASRH